MAEADLTAERCEAIATERIAAVPPTLTELSATFEPRQLIEAVANALVGSRAAPGRTIEMADALVADGHVATLGEARGEAVYSTPEMIATERRLVEVARRLAAQRVAAPEPDLVACLVEAQDLNLEQAAVARAATSGVGLTLVQGRCRNGQVDHLEGDHPRLAGGRLHGGRRRDRLARRARAPGRSRDRVTRDRFVARPQRRRGADLRPEDLPSHRGGRPAGAAAADGS